MSVTQRSTSAPPARERMLRTSPLRRILVRPETSAVAGSIAVWIFFALIAGSSGFLSIRGTSSYLSVASEIAIQAVPVALLMIAGEFDLSIGSTVGVCGMIIVILSTQYGFNIWASIVIDMLFAVLVGLMNGYLVLRTGLPSFIVTLYASNENLRSEALPLTAWHQARERSCTSDCAGSAWKHSGTQYILLGATTGLTTMITGLTQVGGLNQAAGYGQSDLR